MNNEKLGNETGDGMNTAGDRGGRPYRYYDIFTIERKQTL
jgi:hypothetical protein